MVGAVVGGRICVIPNRLCWTTHSPMESKNVVAVEKPALTSRKSLSCPSPARVEPEMLTLQISPESQSPPWRPRESAADGSGIGAKSHGLTALRDPLLCVMEAALVPQNPRCEVSSPRRVSSCVCWMTGGDGRERPFRRIDQTEREEREGRRREPRRVRAFLGELEVCWWAKGVMS